MLQETGIRASTTEAVFDEIMRRCHEVTPSQIAAVILPPHSPDTKVSGEAAGFWIRRLTVVLKEMKEEGSALAGIVKCALNIELTRQFSEVENPALYDGWVVGSKEETNGQTTLLIGESFDGQGENARSY